MQLYLSNREQIEPSAGDGRNPGATMSAIIRPGDFSSANQEEMLALLKPGDGRKRTVILVASALGVGLVLGWAGGANIAAFNSVTQTETPLRRSAEIKSSGKSDVARRTASASSLQTAPVPTPVSPVGAPSTKAEPWTPREPVAPVAETRPTTIDGWTVLEVRGGAAVIEGPDGVRTVVRGDSVPGIGRIDSIVRWGNRWIVATASGLIATP